MCWDRSYQSFEPFSFLIHVVLFLTVLFSFSTKLFVGKIFIIHFQEKLFCFFRLINLVWAFLFSVLIFRFLFTYSIYQLKYQSQPSYDHLSAMLFQLYIFIATPQSWISNDWSPTFNVQHLWVSKFADDQHHLLNECTSLVAYLHQNTK